jgi:branched-chain amino acid transport system permease protein
VTARRQVMFIVLGFVAAAVLVALPHLMSTDYTRQLLNQALIYIVVVVGYNFVTGYIGQLSLAQQGFFAIGGYTSAILATRLGLPFWLCLPAATVVSGLFGLAIGIPTLKVRGIYLVLVTYGFSEIIRLGAKNWQSLTHGAGGIVRIPTPDLFGWHFTTKTQIYYLFLAIAIIAIVVAWRVQKGKFGRAFVAIRDGELAADVMGVNTTYVKTMAFVLSAAFGGVAGSMYAHSFTYISPETFGMGQSVLILSMLLIGGVGTISGAVVGAILLTYLPELLRFAQNYYMMIYGFSILLITIFMPSGVMGWVKQWWRRAGGPKVLGSAPNRRIPNGTFDARALLSGVLQVKPRGEAERQPANGGPQTKPESAASDVAPKQEGDAS